MLMVFQESRKDFGVIWNVWVFLAMPAIWLCWYVVAISSDSLASDNWLPGPFFYSSPASYLTYGAQVQLTLSIHH
jgi:hypothetical protein